jgi:hypothetical protein
MAHNAPTPGGWLMTTAEEYQQQTKGMERAADILYAANCLEGWRLLIAEVRKRVEAVQEKTA